MDKKIQSLAVGGGVTSFIDLKDKAAILDLIYPVGSIYFTMADIDLNTTEPYNNFQWEKLSKGKYLQSTDINAGTEILESLPNITGTSTRYPKIDKNSANNESSSSALYSTARDNANVALNGGSNPWVALCFDASRSSSTYKDGAKVQPDSITVYMWKRIK